MSILSSIMVRRPKAVGAMFEAKLQGHEPPPNVQEVMTYIAHIENRLAHAVAVINSDMECPPNSAAADEWNAWVDARGGKEVS